MSRVSIFDSTGRVFFIFLADRENEIVRESDCKCRVDFRCFYNVKKIFTSWPKDGERHSARLWNKVAKPVTRASLGPDKEEVGVLREREIEIQ